MPNPRPTDSHLRIIVSGLAGLQPVGGMAWHYLQYVVGLARLGHDVIYHEDTWSWPFHPVENTYTERGDYSARFIDGFFQRYAPELCARWHYQHLHEQSFGMARTAFDEFAASADVFLNVSGAGFIPGGLSPRCTKVFIDTDPGYNQLVLSEQYEWSENAPLWRQLVLDHDRHFTFAENIHGCDCTIPKGNISWITTRMPMVMDLWETEEPPAEASWSTVMTWNAFKGKLTYEGVEYKSKGAEFEKLIELPRRVGLPFRVAVGGVEAPLDRLTGHGWQVLDGPKATLNPEQYVRFLASSRGEISAAKHVYVAMRSGWFSERSSCHLALGRPVVVQDTGFGTVLPIGEGLLAFSDTEGAIEAIREIESNYGRHARAAREIAAEYFDSDKVLTQLVEEAMSEHIAASSGQFPAASRRFEGGERP